MKLGIAALKVCSIPSQVTGLCTLRGFETAKSPQACEDERLPARVLADTDDRWVEKF